jgi:aminopeptidase
MSSENIEFPPFSLTRLLRTVFGPKEGERVAILIDLKDPQQVKNCAFLADDSLSIQRLAHKVFYEGLRDGGLAELGWNGGDLFAYEETGGSNLDLPDLALDVEGNEKSFERDIYPSYDIILCISTFSATAPLTAFAKQFGFRGATLHGLNEIILSSGLAVDYTEVSKEAEKLRLALTKADEFEVDFETHGESFTLKILCGQQEAQKSHGLCLGPQPDVANLPAGEVYFVPTGAEGAFPMKYSDGTIGKMTVSGGKVTKAELISGDQAVIDFHNKKLAADPVTGELGELGFGTQVLPVSGRDIQDEKILGNHDLQKQTFHRSIGKARTVRSIPRMNQRCLEFV